jgi:heme oxygenase
MTLREKIKDNHDKAESHPFVKLLFSGNISPEIYADFLYNQMYCYAALENRLVEQGLVRGIEDVLRADKIHDDYYALSTRPYKKYPSTLHYIDYINDISSDNLLAHLYVRHFGDMYGGQMLKSKVPGNGSMYEFKDRAELIKKIRTLLTDDLADEANIVFGYATALFEELANEYNLSEA